MVILHTGITLHIFNTKEKMALLPFSIYKTTWSHRTMVRFGGYILSIYFLSLLNKFGLII